MLKVEVRNKIEFPKITLQETLLEIAEQIIIRDIKAGISAGRAINGGMLPPNDDKTKERKEKKGHSTKSLIDTGFLQGEGFDFRPEGKSKVIISVDSRRQGALRGLQIDGVKNGTKFYRFFGISKDAFRRSMAYAKTKVEEQLHGNKRGG